MSTLFLKTTLPMLKGRQSYNGASMVRRSLSLVVVYYAQEQQLDLINALVAIHLS